MAIVTAKPFDQMSLAELRAEHSRWVDFTRIGGPAGVHEEAYATRDILATWIARREREAARVA